jgi:RecA-family ATPase
MKKEDVEKHRYTPMKGIELIRRVKSEPKRKFIWGGIREGSIGLFVGEGKTGKTTFAENLAISIAVGKQEFFGNTLDGLPKKVAFINLEEDYSITGERLRVQFETLSVKEQSYFQDNFYATPYDFPDFMNSEEDWEKLKEYILSTEAEIIFLDSLTHLFVGEIERSSIAQNLSQTLNKYVRSLGKTVIVIHHTTKGNEKPISQDKVAGSRIISQEFNWAYGFSKIPTEEGGKYMCHLFNKFQYADENIALLYEMNQNYWVSKLKTTNKYKLYNEVRNNTDGREDSKNRDRIYNYIIEQTSQSSQTISSSQLQSEFVESSTMSKDTLFQNLNRLIKEEKILRPDRGVYIMNLNEKENGEGRNCV